MRPLNIALIGYGGIGRVHVMGYRLLSMYYGIPADTIRIVGVVTSRQETADFAAREIGCDLATTNIQELLALNDLDIVDCCVPNLFHEDIVLASASAGKHIYCEKPLAMNAEQARRMAQVVEAAGVNAQMTFNFRFFPAVIRAKQLIQDGFLGKIFSFRGRYFRAST